MVTIVATTLFSAYMLFDPGDKLANLMQLTEISVDFKIFVLVLALGGLACAEIFERRVSLWLARLLEMLNDGLWPRRRKKRKEYKRLLQDMRI